MLSLFINNVTLEGGGYDFREDDQNAIKSVFPLSQVKSCTVSLFVKPFFDESTRRSAVELWGKTKSVALARMDAADAGTHGAACLCSSSHLEVASKSTIHRAPRHWCQHMGALQYMDSHKFPSCLMDTLWLHRATYPLTWPKAGITAWTHISRCHIHRADLSRLATKVPVPSPAAQHPIWRST